MGIKDFFGLGEKDRTVSVADSKKVHKRIKKVKKAKKTKKINKNRKIMKNKKTKKSNKTKNNKEITKSKKHKRIAHKKLNKFRNMKKIKRLKKLKKSKIAEEIKVKKEKLKELKKERELKMKKAKADKKTREAGELKLKREEKARKVKELKIKKEEQARSKLKKTLPIHEKIMAQALKAAKTNKKSTKEEMFLKTEIPGFDLLVKKGIPKGTSLLVEGGPGSGKTIFCLELARNFCRQGKKVLYMSFEEPEERLRGHMASFGTDVSEYEKKGLLHLKRFNALDIARSVEALLSEAKKELLIDVQPVLIPSGFEPEVVLIDSLTSIGSAFSGEDSRFRIYMEQLFRYLEGHNITSFLIRETANPTHTGRSLGSKTEAVSFLSDGIIVIYNVFYKGGERKRAIEVLKLRGTDINRKIVECEIKGEKGLIIYPNKILKGKYTLT